MSPTTTDPADERAEATGQIDRAQERADEIARFVKSNPDYYRTRFHEIGASSRYVFSFNLWAFILVPIWFTSRESR